MNTKKTKQKKIDGYFEVITDCGIEESRMESRNTSENINSIDRVTEVFTNSIMMIRQPNAVRQSDISDRVVKVIPDDEVRDNCYGMRVEETDGKVGVSQNRQHGEGYTRLWSRHDAEKLWKY
jgi:hypothetical protein